VVLDFFSGVLNCKETPIGRLAFPGKSLPYSRQLQGLKPCRPASEGGPYKEKPRTIEAGKTQEHLKLRPAKPMLGTSCPGQRQEKPRTT
jgi:hypothetical protein